MSWRCWNFVRFHEILFETDSESFSFLSWKTKVKFRPREFQQMALAVPNFSEGFAFHHLVFQGHWLNAYEQNNLNVAFFLKNNNKAKIALLIHQFNFERNYLKLTKETSSNEYFNEIDSVPTVVEFRATNIKEFRYGF